MTTLAGDKLEKYFSALDDKFNDLISNSDKSQTYAHSLMRKVLRTELDFLRQYHGAGGGEYSLAFSGNGFPFVESLNKDLSQISELTDEEEFSEIGSIYDPEMEKLHTTNYAELSPKDWEKQLKVKEKELVAQTRFAIPFPTNGGSLDLLVQRDWHAEGVDTFSRNYPIFSETHSYKYHIVFSELFSEGETKYWRVNKDKLNPFELTVKEDGLITKAGNVSKDYLTFFTKGCPLIFGGVIKATTHTTSFTLAIPTKSRKHPDMWKDGGDGDPQLVPAIGWLVANAGGCGLAHLAGGHTGALIYLACSAATNLISGAYEFGRYLRKQQNN